jgi:hypothetical protein
MSALDAATVDGLMALDLEYRLTIGIRAGGGGCDCVRYFISRREVLIPEVLKEAARHGEDPVDTFARYARGVHDRHLSGLSLAVTA